MKCRHCGVLLEHKFLDLGFAPPSNAYLKVSDLDAAEKYYPLRVMVCEHCWLVQTEDFTRAHDLFSGDYAYFSSTSKGWLNHASAYVDKMVNELGLGPKSFVIEVASNDGYLLRNFINLGIPCLGIEPTASTASVAESLGIAVIRKFFGSELGAQLAAEHQKADLILGNNVYAHVPDINDFTIGLKNVLKPDGTITLEFPHLMKLLQFSQFDTIYHEHFSYLSLFVVCQIFKNAGLRIYHVEELNTHGGSLRVYGCHFDDKRLSSDAVALILNQEYEQGLQDLSIYQSFQSKANKIKDDFLTFLIEKKRSGNTVAAYGAAAKGNTLLNYGGVKPDLIPFVCDAAHAKQNKYMPGSHIPILSPAILEARRPDFLVILPWNIAKEVKEQNDYLAALGTKFVIAVPSLQII